MASARCLVAMGDGDLAMESMARLAQRVMATEPEGAELSESLYALGDIAERMARPDRAERAWRAAMASGSADIQQAALQRRIQLLLCHGHDYAVVDLISTEALESNAAGRVLLDVAETFLQRDMTWPGSCGTRSCRRCILRTERSVPARRCQNWVWSGQRGDR